MSYLDRIRDCNRRDLSRFVPFAVDGARVGWIRRDRVEILLRHDDVFAGDDGGVTLASGLDGFQARSAAVAEVVETLDTDGHIRRVRGEDYPVATGFGAPPFFRLDRGAVPFFGVRAYGVHLNGFVRRPGGLAMWIGRRAPDKAVAPGKLDNMVAGGQPIGLTVQENLIKECAEEASIAEPLARRAIPVGAITYCVEFPEGLKPDVQFCYDLELKADFVPESGDGEHSGFRLLPIDEVAAIVRDTDEFKFNCNLVVIDFLVRHGVLGPDDPDYLTIVAELRQ
jgi:8-oxo-dGTP pyrophosphatase MutT (NUDIX family)